MDLGAHPIQNLREKLSQATRQHHDAIEAVMALDRSDFSVDDYFQHLTKFHNFYRDFESYLDHSPTSAAAFYSGGRRKLGLIELDLDSYECRSPIQAPTIDFARILPTEAHIWGAIYVVEGSTLGGQFLSRKFEKNFGDAIANRTHFFSSYKDQVGKCWQETVRAINQLELSEAETEDVIEGAKRTFETMTRYFVSQVQQ